MEGEGENCTAIPPRAGLCCPEKYQCRKFILLQSASVVSSCLSTQNKKAGIVLVELEHIYTKVVNENLAN